MAEWSKKGMKSNERRFWAARENFVASFFFLNFSAYNLIAEFKRLQNKKEEIWVSSDNIVRMLVLVFDLVLHSIIMKWANDDSRRAKWNKNSTPRNAKSSSGLKCE